MTLSAEVCLGIDEGAMIPGAFVAYRKPLFKTYDY